MPRPHPLPLAILLLLAAGTPMIAQKRNPERAIDNAARATVVHTANVYATAESADPPIATVTPGHELVLN